MTETTVDSLSYKQLQALAMSLNLPGKMKVRPRVGSLSGLGFDSTLT